MSVPVDGYSNLLTMSVPVDGYSNLLTMSVPVDGYSNLLTMSVPVDGYSNPLLWAYLLMVIPIFWLWVDGYSKKYTVRT